MFMINPQNFDADKSYGCDVLPGVKKINAMRLRVLRGETLNIPCLSGRYAQE